MGVGWWAWWCVGGVVLMQWNRACMGVWVLRPRENRVLVWGGVGGRAWLVGPVTCAGGEKQGQAIGFRVASSTRSLLTLTPSPLSVSRMLTLITHSPTTHSTHPSSRTPSYSTIRRSTGRATRPTGTRTAWARWQTGPSRASLPYGCRHPATASAHRCVRSANHHRLKTVSGG